MVFVSCHGFLAVFFAYNLGTAHKVDSWSVIAKAGNDALYPEKFNVPLLNVSYPNMGYGGWKSMAGFHFHDIQGYKTTKTINDCLILCNAHPPCRAMNYVSPLSKCVLLGSGVDETMASKALWNNANANSVHIVFTSGSKSKVPTYQPRVPSSKLPFGMPAIAPNIYLTKRQRIVGGTEAVRYSYPFIVRVVSCPQATSCSVCGGTLLPPGADSKSTKVSSDLVLTAAHCVIISGNPTKPSQMYLKLGNHVDDVVEKNEILATVRRILSHKEYNSKLDNDIAVIQLQGPVNFTNFINAIRLPTKDFPTNNNTCVAIGWGRLSGIDHFSRNTMGDSGGPLFCQENVDKTKLFTLYGVTSLVDARSCTLKPGVFVRTYAYMKWITQVAQNINKYADQQHTKV